MPRGRAACHQTGLAQADGNSWRALRKACSSPKVQQGTRVKQVDGRRECLSTHVGALEHVPCLSHAPTPAKWSLSCPMRTCLDERLLNLVIACQRTGADGHISSNVGPQPRPQRRHTLLPVLEVCGAAKQGVPLGSLCELTRCRSAQAAAATAPLIAVALPWPDCPRAVQPCTAAPPHLAMMRYACRALG